VRVRDDPQTRNDQITLCGRKILWVEEMGGNFKHHNITLISISPNVLMIELKRLVCLCTPLIFLIRRSFYIKVAPPPPRRPKKRTGSLHLFNMFAISARNSSLFSISRDTPDQDLYS
jgi:hypothetical protein